MLTIGIPSKGINDSLVRVLKLALSNVNAVEVLIGVNPGQSDSEIPAHLLLDTRVKITHHQSDLGLYGNFRFLAKNASQKYFMWLCTDDTPTNEIQSLLETAEAFSSNLVIPSWDWAEYFPDSATHSSIRNPGPLPQLRSGKDIVISALSAEPSWIFGVWRRDFLLSIFPKKSFDWLDSHLLQRVLISERVYVVDVEHRATIGTWFWKNRLPNSVHPRGHSYLMSLIFQIQTSPRFLMLWPGSLFIIPKRIKNIRRQTKDLNNRIKLEKKGAN